MRARGSLEVGQKACGAQKKQLKKKGEKGKKGEQFSWPAFGAGKRPRAKKTKWKRDVEAASPRPLPCILHLLRLRYGDPYRIKKLAEKTGQRGVDFDAGPTERQRNDSMAEPTLCFLLFALPLHVKGAITDVGYN